MSVMKDSIQGLKPVIFTLWIVAGIRLALDAVTTDLNYVAMASIYAASLVIFVFCGFTGYLDRLVWKPLLAGSLVLGIACWFVPDSIAYTIGQFKGWQHGRFYFDKEFDARLKQHLAETPPPSEKDAKAKTEAELGRSDMTRTAPIADTAAGKIKTGLTVGILTSIGGTLWCLVLGTLFVGIPGAMRRRNAGHVSSGSGGLRPPPELQR